MGATAYLVTMTSINDWQGGVGRGWADEWRRTDRSFSNLTPRLLEAIGAEPGKRIIDIGCGAGELALAIARDRPAAHVTGVDVSADLIAAARSRPLACGHADFALADAATFAPADGPADLYVSRHGVMFFPDPPAAFRHLAQAAAPGARIVFSCFRAAAQNEWASAIAGLLEPMGERKSDTPGEFVPGPFAFADPGHVQRCMAGWTDFAFTPVDFAYVAGAGADPVADALAFFRRIGPAAAAIRALPEAARAAFEERLETLARHHMIGDAVVFSAAAWIVTATAST